MDSPRTSSIEEALLETNHLEALLTSCIGNFEQAHKGLVEKSCEVASDGIVNSSPNVASRQVEARSVDLYQLKIQEQVAFGFKRRSKDFIQAVFSNHCESSASSRENVIHKKSFPKALQDLQIKLENHEIEELFRRVDVDRSDSLSLSEFETIVSQPSDLERWAVSIPLHYLIVDAVSGIDEKGGGVHVMEKASNLTESDIQAICNGILDGMKKMITSKVSELKKAFDAMRASQAANEAGSKFLTVGTMSCGGPMDFHKGLEGRIGTPHLKFLEAMEAEHCTKPGHNHQLQTPNYKITTCPETEWKLVVRREGKPIEEFTQILTKEFPNVGLGPTYHGRRIPDIAELLQLDESKQAKLIKCEVLAIVLYTGPLYMVYNAILRQWPKDLYNVFLNGENLFTTTIHVLVSAVQKLSRSIRIPDGMKLYRGLGGTMDLPDRFYNADDQGCKGFAEWGFMSTTSSRNVAIQYSGVAEGKPRCVVLELRVGAIDRGACLQRFSQYQGEEEYLYMPLSFLQQDRDIYTEVTAGGIVSIIPVRIIPNMKTQTVEEALERKKSLHISAFSYYLDELQGRITELMTSDEAEARLKESRRLGAARQDVMSEWDRVTTAAIVRNVMGKCREVLSRHERLAADDFTDDGTYRALSAEMVSTRTFALSTVRCALEVTPDWRNFGLWVDRLDLLHFHRVYTGFLKKRIRESPAGSDYRQQTALQICQIKGLVERDVEAVNHRGESKLAVAVHDGVGLDLLGLLVDAGANPTGGVAACCSEGNAEALVLLIKRGADVSSVSPTFAVANDHPECLRILVEAKACVDGVGGDDYPVYTAADGGHVDCVRALVEMKANVNRQDPWGWTPLMTVTRRNNSEDRREKNRVIAELLRSNGALG